MGTVISQGCLKKQGGKRMETIGLILGICIGALVGIGCALSIFGGDPKRKKKKDNAKESEELQDLRSYKTRTERDRWYEREKQEYTRVAQEVKEEDWRNWVQATIVEMQAQLSTMRLYKD